MYLCIYIYLFIHLFIYSSIYVCIYLFIYFILFHFIEQCVYSGNWILHFILGRIISHMLELNYLHVSCYTVLPT